MSRILITSAMPYINGVKHIGNLIGSQLPADVYDLFVVDAQGRLRGSVKLGRMLRTRRPISAAGSIQHPCSESRASARTSRLWINARTRQSQRR